MMRAVSSSDLDEEAVFYDPEALVQPIHIKDRFLRLATPDDPKARYTFIECLSNIHNVDGRPKQLNNSDPDFIDYYGRRGRRSGRSTSRKAGKSPTM